MEGGDSAPLREPGRKCGNRFKKMRRHLVYVLNQFSSNESSHFVHVANLLEQIARRGVAVTLIIEKSDAGPTLKGDSVKVIRLPPSSAILRQWRLTRAVRREVAGGTASVFVRIAVPAALACVAGCVGTGARVFYWQSGTVHAIDREHHKGFAKVRWWLSAWLPFRLVVWGVHRFVTGPASMVEYYKDEVGVPRRKLVNLHNDVDVAAFRKAVTAHSKEVVRREMGLPAVGRVLLFVHRLSPVRRTLLYFPAILSLLESEEFHDVQVVVAGAGPELASLAALVAKSSASGRCWLLGGVPHRELPRLFALADIFVNPSFAEGFPRVVIESMAAALPIVTTDAGGTRELVGPIQSEFVVSRTEPEAFKSALRTVLSDSVLRQSLSGENAAWVARFDTPVVAEMYDRVLFE